MQKVAQFIQEKYLAGETNVIIDVYIHEATVYHVVRSNNINLYREFSPTMKGYPYWKDLDDTLMKLMGYEVLDISLEDAAELL